MFADDINVLITDTDVGAHQNKTDRVTTELETWFNRNDLVINAGKTGIMSFRNKQVFWQNLKLLLTKQTWIIQLKRNFLVSI
jgi:hypothetical protein